MRRRKAELAAAKKLMEQKAKEMADVFLQPCSTCSQLISMSISIVYLVSMIIRIKFIKG